MQNFISELSKYLENSFNSNKEAIPIIDDILSKNNVTTGNMNSIIWKEDDVILKYAERRGKSLYFVKDSKKAYWQKNEEHYDNSYYTILKAEDGKIEKIYVKKNEMPKNIGVNDVFKIENGKYVIDNSATKELQEEIRNMAKEIIDKQNINLSKHRKEGHLYLVKEEVGNNRFLLDLTDKSNIEFEETNIPEELLNEATEGNILRFSKGVYEYYSNYDKK